MREIQFGKDIKSTNKNVFSNRRRLWRYSGYRWEIHPMAGLIEFRLV